jgi:cytochrome c553
MAGFAGGLSDEDIADLSAFYASQEGDLHDLSAVKQR